MTNGGGPGVMVADTLANPEALDPETIAAFDTFLPHFWSRGNPIDILGDAAEILRAYGMPMVGIKIAKTQSAALSIGRETGYPLVMKILSPDIIHKTDAGGVQLDLRNDEDVLQAYDRIISSVARYNPDAKICGVTIQPHFPNPDFEILLGAKRDHNFGPVILFGMGGIYTEVLKDRSLGLPPMNRLLARQLMQETKVYALLKGFRNLPTADMEKLIIRLSQLLIDFPQITELGMNPVLIKDGSPVAVDARIRITPVDVPSSLHLVIGPYPEEDESHMKSHDGHRILIRPIKPEDAPLFTALFKKLTPTTIYYRFFGIKGVEPRTPGPVPPRLTMIGRLPWSPWMKMLKPISC